MLLQTTSKAVKKFGALTQSYETIFDFFLCAKYFHMPASNNYALYHFSMMNVKGLRNFMQLEKCF